MPVVTSGATTVGAVQLSGLAPNSTPIESWLNGCLQQKAFGYPMFQAAVAAQNSYIELRNPSGSGKNIWLYSIAVTTVAAGNFGLRYMTPGVGAGTQSGFNLAPGGASSLGKITPATSASVPGAPFLVLSTLANTQFQMGLPWVVVIPPNSSLIVVDNTVNDSITVNFLWMEV